MPLAHLTLLVPELLWPEPEDREALDRLDCPTLATLLARSRLARRPPQSQEATLADLFGHAHSAPHAPYAAFRRLGEPGSPDGIDDACWIAADPVHLRFHQERLILADGATLAIAQEEAGILTEDLNRHFADIGAFHATAAERWYLRLAEGTALRRFAAPPLSAVAGRSVERLLPDIMEDREVRGLLNEMQTLLHAHPVNQRREERGLMPVNSLWLWGAGSLPPRVEAEFDGAWSANPLALGLARAASVPAHPVPVEAARLLDQATPDTRQFVLLEDLTAPVHYQNGEAYRDAIAALEAHWFAPLQKALTSGKLKHLRLATPTAYGLLTWESSRADAWRFWQRAQPLAEIAKTLAKDNS